MTLLAAFVAPILLAAVPADPLAGRIDRLIAVAWSRAGVTPAAVAGDAAFHRRVTLDLIGRIPTAAETRSFLADDAPAKRVALVDRLLASPAHARHAANGWRRAWLSQADAPAFARLADDFEDWVAARIDDRTPYDRMVRELLAVPPGGETNAPGVSPRGFRAASEYKPENLAANTARAFLGVNLDCAQCHDHPFAKWTQDQFWETAAFFARPEGGPARPEVAVGGKKRTVGPRLLTDAPLEWPAAVKFETGPTLLAGWATAKGNPFFARNAVNRRWAQLFGTGLVEPLDEIGGAGPHEFGPVLDDLAAAFEDGGFDLRALTRGIVLSRAYQLSPEPLEGRSSSDPTAFSRSAVRGLTGEQLHDSLRVAAGHPLPDGAAGGPSRRQFVSAFHAERAAAAQRSVVQALTLMNGKLTAAAVDPGTGPLLGAADAPFFDDAGRVDLLFLSALGRPPTAGEAKPLAEHVARGGATGGRRRALADVLWALLNTAEFGTNH